MLNQLKELKSKIEKLAAEELIEGDIKVLKDNLDTHNKQPNIIYEKLASDKVLDFITFYTR